ncbi:MAG: ArsR/SmtB family transcription factor [Planctomycetota bacterium]
MIQRDPATTTPADLKQVIAITRALGDQTRVRALLSLAQGELCVCQIIQLLDLAPSTVSKHMSILHQAGLVMRRKQGRWQHYRLADDATDQPVPDVVRDALLFVRRHLAHDRTINRDAERIKHLRQEELTSLTVCYAREPRVT